MKYAFFYPSLTLGGAELLLVRMARALMAEGWEVLVVDMPGGKLTELLAGSSVAVLHTTRGQPVVLTDTVVVAPASHVEEVRRWVAPAADVRYFFWVLQHYNLVVTPALGAINLQAHLWLLRLLNRTLLLHEYRQMRAALLVLIASNSIAFMDVTCLNTTLAWYRLPALAQPTYLPVPLSGLADELPTYRPPGHQLNMVWVGRLVDFKIYPLLHVIRQLAGSPERHRVCLHIVGAGDRESVVRQALRDYELTYVWHGEMQPEPLRAFLREHADLVVGMGTSALEGASLGLPTLVVDAAYQPFPDTYRFRWLYQNEGYCLGFMLKAGESGLPGGMDMNTVLAEVFSRGQFHAKTCWDYFRANHDLTPIAARLRTLAAASLPSDRFQQLAPFTDGIVKRLAKLLLNRPSSP